MTARSQRRRAFLVPEVVQISNMDCGPASLKCILDGYGIRASYGRLREVCQTEVDGTSINAIEDAASELGLTAEQVLLPPDHLLLPDGKNLPAIVVIRLPTGATHFVVVWRRFGNLLQVMDPAGGRRWIPVHRFTADLYTHTQALSASNWRRWAGSPEAIQVLRSQLTRIGLSEIDIASVLTEALADESWQSVAALEAATRMTGDLIRGGAVHAGVKAARVLRKFFERALREAREGTRRIIPDSYWSVAVTSAADAEKPVLAVRGVVFVRIRGLRIELSQPVADASGASRQTELIGVLNGKERHTIFRLLGLLKQDGVLMPSVLSIAIVVSAGALLVEGLLLRSLMEVGTLMTVGRERLGAAVALVLFLALATGLEIPILASSFRMGRRLEMRLRLAFLKGVPRIRDQFFRSRLVSDMVERCHAVHMLRTLPPIATQVLRCGSTMIVLVIGIPWLAPGSAWPVFGIAVLAVSIPLGGQSMLGERDLRFRTHSASLVRFYLDGMLGLLPIRALGAERNVRREHEGLLSHWVAAGLHLQKLQLCIEAFVAISTLTLIAFALHEHLLRSGSSADALLVVYWLLLLPVAGQEFAGLLRMYPAVRNTAERVMEPIATLDEAEADTNLEAPTHSKPSSPASVRFESVGVRASGHVILEDIDLEILPGSHVAVVGASGAGKTTLIGLLLGWHRPSDGAVLVDGTPLNEARLDSLRSDTAWIDPSVHIWNRSLLENVLYGSETGMARELPGVVDTADLRDLIAAMPSGLQTRAGENGSLLSGGEGQRVRLARALLRRDARLVIMDEPFRGLDRSQRKRLLAAARKWWVDATVICITHDMDETTHFDRVVVMDRGSIIEQGDPRTLINNAQSAYVNMLTSERLLEEELFGATHWRRLRLNEGGLSSPEAQEPAP